MVGVLDPEVRALTERILALFKSGELPADLHEAVAQHLDATGASVLDAGPGDPEADAEAGR